MSVFSKHFFFTSLILLFHFLIPFFLPAQKIKLSRERISALNAIASTQKSAWNNRKSASGKTFEQYMDSLQTANPERYQFIRRNEEMRKQRRESELLQKKRLNMQKYNSILASPDVYHKSSIILNNGLYSM